MAFINKIKKYFEYKENKKEKTRNRETEKGSEYIECLKCGHQTFINRICFRIDKKNQKIIVDQRGDNLFCDKCGNRYDFYKFISYPYKKRSK